MNGRDNRFRPILVLKTIEFINLKLDIDDLKTAMTCFSEYMVDNALLPGQVENWIIINDLTGVGITNFPRQVKKTQNPQKS